MNIISGNNAIKETVQLINKKYKYFKVLILVPIESKQTFKPVIEQILKNVKSSKVLEFPKGVTQICVIEQLIKHELSEDVGLIVNFCNENVLSAVNQVCEKTKILTFLTEPNLNIFLSETDYLVIDNSLLSGVSNKSLADCYGKLCACSFYLLEQVFNKAVFGFNYNAGELLEVEKILQSLVLIPSAILKQSMGKHLLTKICLKLKECVSMQSIKNSYVNKLATTLIDVCKHKTLTKGEALIISSLLCFRMFKVLVNSLSLSSQIGFNSYSRILNTKRAKAEFSFSGVTNSIFCDDKLDEHINNFFNIKTSFAVVFETYENMFNKLLCNFKGLYLDRGVCLNKFLSENNLLTSVNLIPEQFDCPCFATFIRDVGLLNKFNV